MKIIARIYIICCLCGVSLAYGQAGTKINGIIDWEKQEIRATVSLDMAAAGLKLPSGRTRGEAIIASEYLRLIRPRILNVRVDSAAVIADITDRGEWSLYGADQFAQGARSAPPALSPDFNGFSAGYTLDLTELSAALILHERPAEVPGTLSPVPSPDYTGIVIIAAEKLPVHGRNGAALAQPCLFPKIWDSQMNLIFERNMLNPKAAVMARYFPAKSLFAPGPSGLDSNLSRIVGDRPLKIFAESVFGITPTDPVISREDALLIISSEKNRALLREGRLAIILDDSALRSQL